MAKRSEKRPYFSRRVKVCCSAIAFALSSGLWLHSSGIYYRPLEPLTFAVRGPGALCQWCSQRSALHVLLMRTYSAKWPSVHLHRQTYLDIADSRPEGVGFRLGGFALRVLPRTYHGGDYAVSPYAGVVVPYWLTTTALALVLLTCSGLARRLKPYLRFSRYAVPFMAVTALAFAWLNLAPAATYHQGVLRQYGFPQIYLQRAMDNGRTLDFFMGYNLGWRQDKVMENLLLAAVAVLAVGLLCELIRHTVRRTSAVPRPPERPGGASSSG
jgi:hypothetical protein